MKVLFLVVFLFSNVAYGQVKFHIVDNLNSCRKDFSLKLCESGEYNCFKFYKKGSDYVKWDEAFKNEKIRALVQKINRRDNLIFRNACIALPDDITKDELFYAPFKKEIDDKEKHIIVDLNKLAFGAYKDGKLVFWGAANGGVGRCKETGKFNCKTPIGEHQVYEIKKGASRSSLYPVECNDKKKCGVVVYNLIKFSGPVGVHGSKSLVGGNVSHGCIRVFRNDSKYIINFVKIRAKIIVLPY